MKKKYLLSALLGGVMLTACSVEDDLNLSKEAQEANPSAPVFAVSFEDNENPLTRANYVGSHVKFQVGDKMSLYHGVTDANLETFSGWQNAIYEAQAETDNNGASALVFRSRAMIVPGKSILIYPADENFSNGLNKDNTGDAAPKLTIDENQTARTKEKMPYMSEVLTIDDYRTSDKWNNSKPGYNKEYEVVMKRVASTLLLTLNRIEPTKAWPAGVEKITLKKVELKSTDEKAPFTKSIAIEALTTPAVARDVTYNDKGDITAAKYYSWQNQSDVNQNKVESVPAITTTDIDETTNVAQFTLLPTASTFNVELEEDEDSETGYKVKPAIIPDGKGQVIVYTNYGNVTLEDPTEAEVKANKKAGLIWNKLSEANGYPTTISKGLDSLLYNVRLWTPALEGTVFNNKTTKKVENMGSGMRRQVEVDLNKIDMDGLHITDEDHLIAVSKVLPVIGLKKESKFYLDGKGSNKEFRIKTKEGRKAYNDIITYSQKVGSNTYTVGLEKCAVSAEKCDVVVFENTGDEGETLKVPSLLAFKSGTEVQLAVTGTNKWLLDGERTFTNVDSVVVNSGATLQLKGNVANSNPSYKSSSPKNDLEKAKYLASTALVNKGNIVTESTDDVVLYLNTRNFGTITVNGRLRMSGLSVYGIDGTTAAKSLTLVNEVNGKSYTESTTKRGVINLNARLATVDNTNARIYNYGYIEVTGDEGSVLLYANSTYKADFNAKFKNDKWGQDVEHTGDNIFGVLRVKSTSNPLTNIQDEENAKGFVKYKGDITSSALINYVEIEKEANTTIGSMSIPYVEYLKGSKNYVVEVQGKGGSNEDKNKTTVTGGLIVPNGVTISIPANKELSVGNIYLLGEVYRAGTFTITATGTGVKKFVTYVGGAEDDQYKVSSDGGAQN